MIKGIGSTGRYITVTGGHAPVPYISPGSAGAGMIRWNSNMNCMEVNDGIGWKTIDMNFATIDLTPEVESLLEWARKKRDEEAKLKELAETNSAVRLAFENLQKAQEQLEITAHLAREYDKERTS